MWNGTWRKSSHSGYNGDCVEVAFRKSSHSTANGHCVEVADGCGQVHVRDSKDPGGRLLAFTPAAWNAFLDSIKGTRP